MNIIDQIRLEIADCEAVQNSNESDYTKEQAKLFAYEHISEIVCVNNDLMSGDELEQIRKKEFERGYTCGINTVIRNIERFLKEIKP